MEEDTVDSVGYLGSVDSKTDSASLGYHLVGLGKFLAGSQIDGHVDQETEGSGNIAVADFLGSAWEGLEIADHSEEDLGSSEVVVGLGIA